MSFRGDDQRRYGHVPPVQYPIGSQPPQQSQPSQQTQQTQQQQQHQAAYEYNYAQHMDNSSYYGQPSRPQPAVPQHESDLYFSSPADGSSAVPPALPAKPAAYASPPLNAAMSGYQHQYTTQTSPSATYNPQAFARSQSQSLPYHPHPSARIASPSISSLSSFQSPPQNYTPPTYNPAAYAHTNTTTPQRSATYGTYNPAVTTASLYNASTSPVSPSAISSSPQLYIQQQQQQQHHYASAAAATAALSSQTAAYEPQYIQNLQPAGSTSYLTSPAMYPTSGSSSVPPAPLTPTSALAASSSSYAIPSTMTSQTPHPTYGLSPSVPTFPSTDSIATATATSVMGTRGSRSNSAASPLPSPPGHSPSPGSLQRHPTNAPLPSRPPMEEVHEGQAWHRSNSTADEQVAQDSLFYEIEADLGVGNGNGTNGTGHIVRMPTMPRTDEELDVDDLLRKNSQASTQSSSHWSSTASMIDRTPSTVSTVSSAYRTASTNRWEDDSDPEGAFGVYEMQQADLDEQRFSVSGASATSGASTANTADYNSPQYGYPAPPTSTPLPPTPSDDPNASDSEFVGMDIGLFSGGYAGNLTYGSQVGMDAVSVSDPPPLSTTPRPYDAGDAQYTPFADANMDYGGTGGLQRPDVHRLSFDEGDEHAFIRSTHSGSESPYKDDYPDMFYHPGMSNRPLPAIPPVPADGSNSNGLLTARSTSVSSKPDYQQHSYSLSAETRSTPYYAQQDLLQQQQQQQLQVERSTSMLSHSTSPAVQIPGRSRTDAAEERRKAQRQLAAQQGAAYDNYDTASSTSMTYDVITLPSGRRRKFVPSKLSVNDFRRCPEPWALSSIALWIREMADGEPDLKRKTIEDGLVMLFTAKVPTMNVADAETLAAMVADSMFAAGMLIPEEEWVKFGSGEISGVLWQLTGSGCYSSYLHEPEIAGRCYSYHCMRTLKKANLNEVLGEGSTKKEDWVTFYGITKEVMEGKPRKEIERQNVLHEIVTSEEEFNDQLDVLCELYKKPLQHGTQSVIPPNRLDRFVNTVFGKVESMRRVNADHLLAQLKYRQNEQGPWISGFSDIFREWIRKAKDEFLAYSLAYPAAAFAVRREAARNVLFAEFLERVRNHKRCNRLGWDTFLKAPITRLQRYSLLLKTVLKNMPPDKESEEKTNLIKAIEEIQAVTKECDRLVAEMGRKVWLQELQSQLVFRPGSQTVLNLDHLGRELLMQGDLQRMGSKGVRWVDTHALLFDHYFILAKIIGVKDGKGDKKYDVSKEPIPMPLLVLESMNDDPIAKQKGLAAPLTRTAVTSASDTKLNKIAPNGSVRPELEHVSTNSSLSSHSRLPSAQNEEGRTLYPFRVKHLGNEIYTLYATSAQSREDWCSKIIEAKTRHAKALLEQNAEPFRLRVLSDCGFAYDSMMAMSKMPSVVTNGTPLDRSIRDMDKMFGQGRGPPPVCRASVNCAAGFTAFGKPIIAIGTDFGVYISEASNPRGWSRTVKINRVTQIAVLEEFSVCLILADKSLISYPLDVVAPVSGYPAPMHESQRRSPQRLAKDVNFFATARMKDRMLVFYKRKEGMHTMFKVLEPVFQKSSEKKNRLFGGRKTFAGSGTTESFRDFDDFYLPTECYSLNLFQTYVAVSTARGIEMLTLDRKQPMSVPCDLGAPAIANIAARIRDQRPLGMFRLNDQEFLLAYEDCAVYANKHGDVSRTLIMEYSGKQKKARAATMFGQYLLLFNEDYVEVRNADNGRLRQIISGVDVRCLDFGFRGPTGGDNASASAHAGSQQLAMMGQDSKGTVKICMAHPEVPGMQIVLELLLNDGHAEA